MSTTPVRGGPHDHQHLFGGSGGYPPAEVPSPVTVIDERPAPAGVPDRTAQHPVGHPRNAGGDSATRRYLVPVLSFGRELALRGMVLVWFVAMVWFWLWWTAGARGSWSAWRVAATAFLGWASVLSAYFAFFACRMTKPNPRLAVPDLRAAMVVTKAPSEPWPVVEKTLRAMLAQDYPHDYDVWLADELPTEESLRWCAARGVKVSTRRNVEDYQQPSWPRRQKSKEGNLAYFYDTVGYERYDVVSQLDADHVPAPAYLANIVRPFADPAIGYVAAPSVCDANQDEGWTVRGRLYREASMHGPVQAGCNGGWAPVCIGSHYAVRTAALRDAGGLGPELAEDYSTTLWLQSAGWDGVFSIDAEAHGDGPETFDAMMIQEVQWSRSLGAIFSRWAPARLRTVRPRARLRLRFALLYYPIQGLFLAAGTLFAGLAVLCGTSWGSTSLAGFYFHLWPASIILFSITWFLRRSGLLRPTGAKLWSTDVALFQLVRWPWTTLAFFRGMWAGWRKDDVPFRVTPKGGGAAEAPGVRYLIPMLAMGLFNGLIVILVQHPGKVLGMYLLVTLQAVLYLVSVIAVVLRGRRAGRRAGSGSGVTTGGVVAAMLAMVVLTGVVLRYTPLGSVVQYVPGGALF